MRQFTVFIMLGVALGYPQDRKWEPIAQSVTLMPIGPFGESLTNCKVISFVTWKDGVSIDRKTLFIDLVGKDIPFGAYSVDVRCDVPKGVTSVSQGVASIISVKAHKDFVVVSSHRWLGDHLPGGGPRFRIHVQKSPGLSEPLWVKLVGIYLSEVHVVEIDKITSDATIVGATPGNYVLMLLIPPKVLCMRELLLLNPWESVSGERFITIDMTKGCEINEASGIEIPPKVR
jgi:hypothetical protein